MNDLEDEMVLDCGFEGCCMPGYHLRSECHNAEMMEAQEEEYEREKFEVWAKAARHWPNAGPDGRHTHDNGSYRNRALDQMWQAWMARARS